MKYPRFITIYRKITKKFYSSFEFYKKKKYRKNLFTRYRNKSYKFWIYRIITGCGNRKIPLNPPINCNRNAPKREYSLSSRAYIFVDRFFAVRAKYDRRFCLPRAFFQRERERERRFMETKYCYLVSNNSASFYFRRMNILEIAKAIFT